MLNKIKNMKLSKSKYLYIVMTCLIIIAIGFTLAWWRWSGDINALIYGEVCAPEIVFVGGTTINGRDLLPVKTKEEGLSKDIKVNLDNTCDNDTAVLNLILKPDVFPEGLSDASFKWAVYKVTTEEVEGTPTETLTYVNDGNFSGKRQYVNDDDLISIATDLVVTENISTYRLFIWIDANMDNPSTIGDNLFKFSLYGEGKDAIYNEYTMKKVSSTSSTSSFWNSPIKANQVKSITFTKKSEMPIDVPEGNTMDVSSVANSGDVVMWWIENGTTTDGTTTLYDVYVGSKSLPVRANTSALYMFASLSNCESIDLTNLDTTKVTTMGYMFFGCSSLTTLDLSSFDTSKVATMKSMFDGCSSLSLLNLSSFDTSKVTDMTRMFCNCSSLSSLNLSSFDTSKVTDMTRMFSNCSSILTTLDLSSFDTSKVTDMSNMFYNCRGLTTLDLSSFDTSNVTDMSVMFSNCRGLTTLDLSSFDTSNVTNMYAMFTTCPSLTTLVLSSFDTSSVKSMSSMFSGCSSLTTLDVSSFDTSNVTDMTMMFFTCYGLTTLDLSSFDFTNVTSSGKGMNGVNSACNITVKDCTQYKLFTDNWGSSFTGLHTVNNDTCSV